MCSFQVYKCPLEDRSVWAVALAVQEIDDLNKARWKQKLMPNKAYKEYGPQGSVDKWKGEKTLHAQMYLNVHQG